METESVMAWSICSCFTDSSFLELAGVGKVRCFELSTLSFTLGRLEEETSGLVLIGGPVLGGEAGLFLKAITFLLLLSAPSLNPTFLSSKLIVKPRSMSSRASFPTSRAITSAMHGLLALSSCFFKPVYRSGFTVPDFILAEATDGLFLPVSDIDIELFVRSDADLGVLTTVVDNIVVLLEGVASNGIFVADAVCAILLLAAAVDAVLLARTSLGEVVFDILGGPGFLTATGNSLVPPTLLADSTAALEGGVGSSGILLPHTGFANLLASAVVGIVLFPATVFVEVVFVVDIDDAVDWIATAVNLLLSSTVALITGAVGPEGGVPDNASATLLPETFGESVFFTTSAPGDVFFVVITAGRMLLTSGFVCLTEDVEGKVLTDGTWLASVLLVAIDVDIALFTVVLDAITKFEATGFADDTDILVSTDLLLTSGFTIITALSTRGTLVTVVLACGLLTHVEFVAVVFACGLLTRVAFVADVLACELLTRVEFAAVVLGSTGTLDVEVVGICLCVERLVEDGALTNAGFFSVLELAGNDDLHTSFPLD